MISICVPVTLVISYSLIIPLACHLFNRKQINYLFLYIAKALMQWTTQNSHELERTVGTEFYYKALINITAAPWDPTQHLSPHHLVLPSPRDKSPSYP